MFAYQCYTAFEWSSCFKHGKWEKSPNLSVFIFLWCWHPNYWIWGLLEKIRSVVNMYNSTPLEASLILSSVKSVSPKCLRDIVGTKTIRTMWTVVNRQTDFDMGRLSIQWILVRCFLYLLSPLLLCFPHQSGSFFRLQFPQLFQLFHCYLEILTKEGPRKMHLVFLFYLK